jgi:hypothetical protein
MSRAGKIRMESNTWVNFLFQKLRFGQVPVAHACNPSYSRGRVKEDHGLKPAWANSSQELILKIPNMKRAGGVAQGIRP